MLDVLIAVAVAAAGCSPDVDGLALSDGWCATVFHDGVGPARHLVVDAQGDVYVRLRRGDDGGIVALRDTDGDGQAEQVARFEASGGTGIALYQGYLYASTATSVFRYPLRDGELVPQGAREAVVVGLPGGHAHDSKSLTFDADGWMYVNLGAPSNACQVRARSAGSPGMDPCPQLLDEAGIWRFRAERLGQSQSDGERFVTGTRNAVAIDFDRRSGAVFVVQHGRDQLASLWPALYDVAANAELPAEEFLRLTRGADFGWPYCYFDPMQALKVLAPEYGGDGRRGGRCADAADPILAFPAHWAPNDLLFIDGGALIAFHGSWNRAPLPQQGYKVMFVPMTADGIVSGEAVVFADGFAGAAAIMTSRAARYRPMGLAQGPSGALFIVDSRVGRIWRLTHMSDRSLDTRE
jgi:glucose/arabinose dehydrogenase